MKVVQLEDVIINGIRIRRGYLLINRIYDHILTIGKLKIYKDKLIPSVFTNKVIALGEVEAYILDVENNKIYYYDRGSIISLELKPILKLITTYILNIIDS